MNSLAKILLYFAAVIALAALLAPPIYWAAQALAGHGVLPSLAAFPFYRFFSRLAQVVAFVLLIPLLFWLNIRSVREFGIEKNPYAWRDLTVGLFLALGAIVLLSSVYLGFDFFRVKKDIIPSALPRIVLSAAIVPILEEFLFRGVLLGLAVKAWGRLPGLAIVSLAFAIVHFIKPSKAPVAEVEWWSGFAQILHIFSNVPPPPLLALGFASLFLAGWILGVATLRTRSLWLAIGFHSAWILGQQGLQWFAKYRVNPPDAYLPWVGPNVVSGAVPTGLIPLAALLLTAGGMWLYIHRVRPSHS